jgi:hypothetical protein
MALVVIMISAALAYDLGNQRRVYQEMQNAVDLAALAGVAKISKSTSQVQTEARAIATANGLTTGDLTAGGDVDVGTWDPSTKTFTPGGGSPNAVRVRARRNVPTFFGRVAGTNSLASVVTGIASTLTYPPECVRPFGLVLTDDSLVPPYPITIDEAQGNWQKIELPGMQPGKNEFIDGMADGVCLDALDAGMSVNPYPGTAGVSTPSNGFEVLPNAPIYIPIVTRFGAGNSMQVTIEGFAKVTLDGQPTGSGGQWTATFRILEILDSLPTRGPVYNGRNLVG